jgi:hypothetical protein
MGTEGDVADGGGSPTRSATKFSKGGTRGETFFKSGSPLAAEASYDVTRHGGRRYARLVKIEHSVFALPFAYAGLFLAAGGWPGRGRW